MRTALTLSLLLFTVPLFGRTEDDKPPEKVLSPYFFVEGNETKVDSFPLSSTSVTADISGTIAKVVVTQVYENRGATPIHARYVFPGSTRAAVHGMRIRVGNKAVVARIRERQKAKQEFTEAKAAGKSASLLEQDRPNVFSMAVANILPGDRVEVELTYSEMLVPEEGVYQFVYPTVVGPRYSNIPESAARETDKWVQSPYLKEGALTPSTFSIRVNVSTGIPLADLRSPSHAPAVQWDNPSAAHVVVENGQGNRDFILYYRLSGKQIQSGLLVFEGPEENFFLLTVQPPERVAPRDIPAREYIFVLDVSGSMHGFPLNTAKQVIQDLIGKLKPSDTFNVILFSGGSNVLSPKSLEASSESIRRALRFIDRTEAGGGTELKQALQTALRLPRSGQESRSVVVITDGYIATERDVLTLIHDNLDATNFFAFGIGSSVNRYLIEGIARAGQGEPFVVTDPGEASATADRFRRYIESPVLSNVQVSFRGFQAYDVEPEAQPDLFAERPLVVVGKWRGVREGQIELTGRSGAGTFTKTIHVKDVAVGPENAALPQLWARNRIARLADFNTAEADDEAIRQVTSLGLTYSLLTPYTSFIAVLEEVRNASGQGEDVNQPLPLPDGVSNLAVGGQYGSVAEPGSWILVGVGVLLIAITAWRKAASC
jgi:Ca-activated chloride channel family protein